MRLGGLLPAHVVAQAARSATIPGSGRGTRPARPTGLRKLHRHSLLRLESRPRAAGFALPTTPTAEGAEGRDLRESVSSGPPKEAVLASPQRGTEPLPMTVAPEPGAGPRAGAAAGPRRRRARRRDRQRRLGQVDAHRRARVRLARRWARLAGPCCATATRRTAAPGRTVELLGFGSDRSQVGATPRRVLVS